MQNKNYELTDFEILDVIGQGSFSRVRLVRKISDGKFLALKQVNMDRLGLAEKQSALNQIRLLASIESPYVISYVGSFYSAQTNSLCLLMQYADGGDLQTIINNAAKKTKMNRGLPESFIWRTMIHLLQGLKTLHQSNIAHRDMKAANIFYNKKVAKIGDFNVSSVSPNSFYSTKTGTPYYTAPQIWKGEKYTTNCDIWSLGCICYQMCALLPPFRAETFPELFLSVSRGQYEPLSLQYSDDIRTFVRMCLITAQTQRPTAVELLNSPILLKRLSQFKDDIDFSGKVELLKPIKCPKVLRFINQVLPQPNQEQIHPQNHKKKVRLEQKIQVKERATSIAKNKNTEQLISSKKSIRIKSCNNIKNARANTEIESRKVIKCPSIYEKGNFEEQGKQLGQSKNKKEKVNYHITSEKNAIKSQNFRLRSYKKIIQKQNILQKP